MPHWETGGAFFMCEQLRNQVMQLIAAWESGHYLMPDAVGRICDLVDSSNVDEIAESLPAEMCNWFTAQAKCCAEGADWFHVGSGAQRLTRRAGHRSRQRSWPP